MSLRLIKLRFQYGALFAGEVGGWPDEKADELIASGMGVEVDEDGNEIGGDSVPASGLSSAAAGDDDDGGAGDQDQWKFDAKTDPFVTDGLSQQAAKALHAIGTHTVDAVRKFIANRPEGVDAVQYVNDVPGVTDAQAEKIVNLYGTLTEHSDE